MMKKVLFLLSLMFVFAVSCGSSSDPVEPEKQGNPAEQADSADTPEDTDHADSEKPSDPSEPADDPADSTDQTVPAEPSETPDEDSDPEEQKPEEPAAEKFCQYACTTASDCIQSGSNAITDEDNYKCENRKCVYLGCLSDAECDEIYGPVTAYTGKVYRCNKNGSYGYPECTPECTSASDCAAGETTDNAFDLDNYKCESGFCVYTGCNSDSECQSGGLDYMRCFPEKYGDKTLKICNKGCDTPADCGSAIYPAELYLCENKQCKMKNCESDEWCAEQVNSKFSCL